MDFCPIEYQYIFRAMIFPFRDTKRPIKSFKALKSVVFAGNYEKIIFLQG